MNVHELHPAPGARTKPTRKGLGIGSGLGKTAGRGHKGQKARAGGGVRRGFEGGQMPLQRRLPKRGMGHRFQKEYTPVNVGALSIFEAGSVVTPESLLDARIVRKVRDGIKILGDGELNVALTVRAHAFSQSALQKITAAGGKAEVI